MKMHISSQYFTVQALKGLNILFIKFIKCRTTIIQTVSQNAYLWFQVLSTYLPLSSSVARVSQGNCKVRTYSEPLLFIGLLTGQNTSSYPLFLSNQTENNISDILLQSLIQTQNNNG